MNNYLKLSIAGLLLVSCQATRTTNNKDAHIESPKELYGTMQIRDTVKSGEPVQLIFTVYNPAGKNLQFCKWHTPFEPLMSKYLEIKNENGEEAAYQGPMAKRVMPPPADSYLEVKAKDSLTAKVDLLKAYQITKPATYTIVYRGQNMSGVTVKDSVSFVYGR